MNRPFWTLRSCSALAALWLAGSLSSAVPGLSGHGGARAQEAGDPERRWAVREGFAVRVDAAGFELPTAIAFVPDPGEAPDDPLYFVTELRGTIKVVTRDRSVHRFAEVETVVPEREYPALEGQTGLAGLCLDPVNGSVFATSTYEDEGGVVRNTVTRFAGEPVTFSLRSRDERSFAEVLRAFPSAFSHQIGGCAVVDDALFVSVGDGAQPAAAADPDQLLGKVLRLTLDGGAHPENRFFDPDDPTAPAGYVYASGFRNPFGITSVGDDVFVSENGLAIDRFLRVRPGEDHHWTGDDASMGLDADVVFEDTLSPVHVAFLERGAGILPGEYANRFFVAIAGARDSRPGVYSFEYDTERRQARSVPEYFVQYHGEFDAESGLGTVAGVDLGPDGVYFAPLAVEEGPSPVLKVVPDTSGDYSTLIGDQGVAGLMRSKGCFDCHMRDGEGGAVGPQLDRNELRLRNVGRLSSEEYEAQLDELDRLDEEPFVSSRPLRRELRQAGDGFPRLEVYVKNQILQPKFDNADDQMPDLDVTEAEAAEIRDFLLRAEPEESLFRRLVSRHRAQGFAAGAVVALVGLAAVRWAAWPLARRWSRRRSDA